MMSAEQNDLLTRVEGDRPAGDLLRRYWQPAALVDELPEDRPIRNVRLFGEELVLFRDEEGLYGLVDRHCPHRGADLCFGRLEDGGLRCPFHGWLFGADGQCLEMPAEPADSSFYKKIRTKAYPCIERSGIIFTYMGPGDPPALPDFDCFVAPDDYTFAFKGLIECNWLQAVEVGIDPAHASYLHRFFEDEDHAESYGKQFRDQVGDSGVTITEVLREQDRPEINVEETDYGLRLITLRDLPNNEKHVRLTNLVFPNAFAIPMSGEMMITQWHVPVDDVTNYWYAIFTSFGGKVDKKAMRDQRLKLYTLPNYVSRQNKSNNYGFDADEQRTQTYTGMGMDINVHDQWAIESCGPIQDRTKEHLGTSDIAITKYRRMLRNAMNTLPDSENLPLRVNGDSTRFRGPIAVDTIAPADDWESSWRAWDNARRAKSSWSSEI